MEFSSPPDPDRDFIVGTPGGSTEWVWYVGNSRQLSRQTRGIWLRVVENLESGVALVTACQAASNPGGHQTCDELRLILPRLAGALTA